MTTRLRLFPPSPSPGVLTPGSWTGSTVHVSANKGAGSAPIPPAATSPSPMMGAAGFFSGRSQGCCTLDRRTPVDRFRIFPAIPRFFLERRFPVDGLPCAEGPALHMGEFQRC